MDIVKAINNNVIRAINNNIISSYDNNGREVIFMGKGIGFKAKNGEIITEDLIEKTFHMSSQKETDQLKELFGSLSPDIIDVSNTIINYAKNKLGNRLNENIYITLMDHISFSVYRYNQGMRFHNALLSEVRRFYPKEFSVGVYAVTALKESIGIRLPDDEAASIALHIVNAEYDTTIGDAFHATQIIDEIVKIASKKTGQKLNETFYYWERFIAYLRGIAWKIIKNEKLPDLDNTIYYLLKENLLTEMTWASSIADKIYIDYNYVLPKEEIASLAMHLKRINSISNILFYK